MSIKIYDGSSWNTQKALKLYDGSNWNSAKQGWIYNGSQWSLMYPEYPLSTAAPTISGTTSVGSVLTTTDGSWETIEAYGTPTFSYKWKRGSSYISGETNSTYTTVSADSGQSITCEVSATNLRGTTPVVSSNSINVNLPAPSSITSSSITSSVGSPSVSMSGGASTFSGSFTSASNATFYIPVVSSTGGYGSYSPAGVLTSATSINGTSWGAGTVTLTVYSFNGNKVSTVSWSPVSGATSYDLSWSGDASGSANTTGTSYNIGINNYSTSSSITFYVTPKSGSFSGDTASTSVTLSATQGSGQASATVTDPVPAAPSGGSVTLTGATTYRVSWNYASYATSYEIYWLGNYTPPAYGYQADYTGITTNYYDLTGSIGSTRHAWVRSRNSAGISDWTYCGYVVMPSAPSAPSTPTNGWSSGTTYPFSWSAPSSNGGSAIQYYNIRLYEATSSTGTGSTNVNNFNVFSGTSYTYTSPNSSRYYAADVAAWNGYYWGTYSAKSAYK